MAFALDGLDEPRIHGGNLFVRHHKKAAASIGIGQGAVGTAPFNVQHLHERIETVVRRVLIGNARERERIPERMVFVIDTHLRQRILEEAGVESGIVGYQREVPDEGADFPGNVSKLGSAVKIGLADARQALNEGAKFRTGRLHQKIERILGFAFLEADESDFDNLVVFEFEPGCFQIHSNKIRYLFHFTILYGNAGNGALTKSFKTLSPFFTLIVSLGALQGFP